jgi:hypothetical protein
MFLTLHDAFMRPGVADEDAVVLPEHINYSQFAVFFEI